MSLCLGIDFERVSHLPAYRKLDGSPDIGVDLDTITDRLLDVFEQRGVTVTFFVVGELATERPDLIGRIHGSGHEIASHTLTHRSLPTLSRDEKREEIVGSKDTIEAVIGDTVRGFRAPTCQIDDECYQLIAEAGYSYSSSVMPCLPIPGFYSTEYDISTPTVIETSRGTIDEYPLGVHPRLRLPVSGAWIRLLGRRMTLSTLRAHTGREPVIMYTHPWEFDSISGPLPFHCRYRTGKWLWKTYQQILDLDREFPTISELPSPSPDRVYEIEPT